MNKKYFIDGVKKDLKAFERGDSTVGEFLDSVMMRAAGIRYSELKDLRERLKREGVESVGLERKIKEAEDYLNNHC